MNRELDCGLTIVESSEKKRIDVNIIEGRIEQMQEKLKYKMKENQLDEITAAKQIMKDDKSSLSLQMTMGNNLKIEMIFKTKDENNNDITIVTNKMHEKTFLKVFTKANLETMEERLSNYIKSAAKSMELGKPNIYAKTNDIER